MITKITEDWSLEPIYTFDELQRYKKKLQIDSDKIPCNSSDTFEQDYLNNGIFLAYLKHDRIKSLHFLVEIEPEYQDNFEQRFKFFSDDNDILNITEWTDKYNSSDISIGKLILAVLGDTKIKEEPMFVLMRYDTSSEPVIEKTFSQPISLVDWMEINDLPSKKLDYDEFLDDFRIDDEQVDFDRYEDSKTKCEQLKSILNKNLKNIETYLLEIQGIRDVKEIELEIKENSENKCQIFINYKGKEENLDHCAILNLQRFTMTDKESWMPISYKDLKSKDNYLLVREWCDIKNVVLDVYKKIETEEQFHYRLVKIKQKSGEVSFSDLTYRLKCLHKLKRKT